jgi:hypothetical protein
MNSYARLFLLRPVLFPGCYGHVYVFRILKKNIVKGRS